MNAKAIIAFIVPILATTCAYGRFIYTESGNLSGTLTDGVWTLAATRARNTNNLTVNGSSGSFSGSAQSALDLTEIFSDDGETQYHAVTFQTVPASAKAYLSAFIAPDCKEIKSSSFQGCTALTDVQLNASVTRIENQAFLSCSALASFYPRTLEVTYIYAKTFQGCSKLDGAFNLPNCTLIDNYAFNGCALLESVTAPVATTIRDAVFTGCTHLTTVYMPSVQQISNQAFQSCTSLGGDAVRGLLNRKITLLGNNAIANQKYIFLSCTSLSGEIEWNFPLLQTNVVAQSMFQNCTSLTGVNFVTDVAEIKDNAFKEIAPGAEVHMPLKVPVVYGSGSVCRQTAPYPKVYLKGNFEDWLAAMSRANHVILREEFNDTGWSHTYGSDTRGWAVITNKMASDSTMCTKTAVDGVTTVTVPDKKVIAFVMLGGDAGCWVLREPRKGTTIMVQ